MAAQTATSRRSASSTERGQAGRLLRAAIAQGEALTLEPPLRFRIRPGVLRVRIAHKHPAASPSAVIPEIILDGVMTLGRIAAGGDLTHATTKEA
jgi:hypothetical protein